MSSCRDHTYHDRLFVREGDYIRIPIWFFFGQQNLEYTGSVVHERCGTSRVELDVEGLTSDDDRAGVGYFAVGVDVG